METFDAAIRKLVLTCFLNANSGVEIRPILSLDVADLSLRSEGALNHLSVRLFENLYLVSYIISNVV